MRNVLLAVVGLAVFAGVATSAPVPKALKKRPLRATIEPLPGEKVFDVSFDDVPFAKVADELERISGLLFLSKDVPKLNVTLKAEKVCVPELFALLDELLYPQGWVLIRKKQSYSLHSTDERVPQWRRWATTISTLNELERRSVYEPHAIVLALAGCGDAAIDNARGRFNDKMFEAYSHGSDQVMVKGRTMDILAFVAEMGDHIKK